MKKKLMLSAVGVLLVSGLAFAMDRHPNLTIAEKDLSNADEHISAAQRANEFDMGGHAAKAKELIGAAKEQIRLAREAANENRR